MLAIHVLTDLGHALAWATIYATMLCIVLLVLLAETTNVALFAGDKRADRARNHHAG